MPFTCSMNNWLIFSYPVHTYGNPKHEQCKENEQIFSIDRFPQLSTGKSSNNTSDSKTDGDCPAYITGTRMRNQIYESIDTHSKRRRADNQMRIVYADPIEQQWDRKNGATAANQSQGKSYDYTSQNQIDILSTSQSNHKSSSNITLTN